MDKAYERVIEFLESEGYRFVKDPDELWLEDEIQEHTLRDLIELMYEYSQYVKEGNK